MKSSTSLFITLLYYLVLHQTVFCSVFYSDSIIYRQPNDVTFIGREWGDEFLAHMETQDGYRFVQGVDGWYYYAILDAEGKYSPSSYRVAIDQPLMDSYQLEPSADYLNQVEQERQNFEAKVEMA